MSDRYAVLIPWVETGNGEALLLEVRSQKVRQPGEVCFPGGRVEAGESVVDAAVRETCEELGLTAEDIDVVSALEPLIMGDGREVHPVTARLRIGDPGNLTLSHDEVAEVFLLPLDWLRENAPVHFDLANTPDKELPVKLRDYLANYGDYRNTGKTNYLEYDGHGIWGLTARIIRTYILEKGLK